jgi:hypothetical protein
MDFNLSYLLDEKNYYTEKTDKEVIILGNSFNSGIKHVNGWKNRLGGNYTKTTTFTVDRKGVIYKHFEDDCYSDFIGSKFIDKKSITITLENIGWLDKDHIKDRYIDWVGNIYKRRVKVFEKRWRGYSYWEPYTTKQINSAIKLANYLCEKHDIPKKVVSHNTKVDGIESFSGVAYRSNFFKENTDLNPSFDFKKFKNKISEKLESNGSTR